MKIVILSVLSVIALSLFGCAETKTGQTIAGYDLLAANPNNTGSQAILGPGDKPTILSGQGSVESSIADDVGWRETNQGGQSKVRRYTRIGLADGNAVLLYESNPANESLGELVVTAPGGSFESLSVKGRQTDLAIVQAQVVALYSANLEAAIKATDAEYKAIIEKISAQQNVAKEAIAQVVPMLNAARAIFTGGL